MQIAGPPVIIFWLGGRADAITVRANLMVFFVLLSAAACVAYLAQGLIAADITALVGLPTPDHAACARDAPCPGIEDLRPKSEGRRASRVSAPVRGAIARRHGGAQPDQPYYGQSNAVADYAYAPRRDLWTV